MLFYRKKPDIWWFKIIISACEKEEEEQKWLNEQKCFKKGIWSKKDENDVEENGKLSFE